MIVVVGVIQGVGLGFLFLPLTVVTLGTLPPEDRAEGRLFDLGAQHRLKHRHPIERSLVRNTQINHADIGTSATPFNWCSKTR